MKSTERIAAACRCAAFFHANQVRKTDNEVPFIVHPLAVGGLVLEFGGDEDAAIAGILHDSIEDGGVTAAWIEDIFGPRVMTLVMAVTEEDKGVSWEHRKTRFLKSIPYLSKDAALICACDKLHNLRSFCADYLRHGESVLDVFNVEIGILWGWYSRVIQELDARGDLPPALITLLGRELKFAYSLMENQSC